MIKFFALAIAVVTLSFFLSRGVAFGQTATPTPTNTPTPTTVVPSGAPATGFGPY